jgi:hypothetical protein
MKSVSQCSLCRRCHGTCSLSTVSWASTGSAGTSTLLVAVLVVAVLVVAVLRDGWSDVAEL